MEMNSIYRAIKRLIDNPRTCVQLQFVADIAPMFTKFLQDFQHEGCMIHVLYPAVRELMARSMLRFLQTQVVENKTGIELQKINVRNVKNMQTIQKMEIGEATKQAMMKMIKAEQHNAMLLKIRNFFICTAEYFQRNLPLDKGLLRAVQCLSPNEQTKSESEARIKRLVQKMPQISQLASY